MHLSWRPCKKKVCHTQNLLTFVAANALLARPMACTSIWKQACCIMLSLGYPHGTFRWKRTANYRQKCWSSMIRIFRCFRAVFATCNTSYPVVSRLQWWASVRWGPWSKVLIFSIQCFFTSQEPWSCPRIKPGSQQQWILCREFVDKCFEVKHTMNPLKSTKALRTK